VSKGHPARRKYGHLARQPEPQATASTERSRPEALHVDPPRRETSEPRPRPSRRRIWGYASRVVLGVLAAALIVLAGFRIAAALREVETAEALAPEHGRFVDTAGGRIFLQDSGPRDGIPVVLIHGTAAWSEFWRGTIDHLTGHGYRVIVIDLPPFGFSDRSASGAYSRSDQAMRIIGVLNALGIGRAVLVGHSFGAGATVETVLLYPERIRGLVLVAAALGLPEPGEPAAASPAALMTILDLPVLPGVLIAATATNPLLTRRLLASMISRKEAATEELAGILRRPMARSGTTADFARWAKSFLAPDLTARSMDPQAYRSIAAKTRLIWGDLDTLTPLPQGTRLEALIPGARLALLKGVGHIPQIEDPQAFRPLLVEALAEVAR
jgi:pimeloyl-ACP methyl ester carboxylesterase